MKTLTGGIKIALFRGMMMKKLGLPFYVFFLTLNILPTLSEAQDTKQWVETIIIKLARGKDTKVIPQGMIPKPLFESKHLQLNNSLKGTFGLGRIYTTRVLGTSTSPPQTASLLEYFNNSSDFEYAQLDTGFVALSNQEPSAPNDPQIKDQWGIMNFDLDLISQLLSGEGVTIAHVDSGIDLTHPDLGALWTNQKELNGEAGVDDDDNGYIDDIYGYDFSRCNYFQLRLNEAGNVSGFGPCSQEKSPGFSIEDFSGHGTQTAGIIGAESNNNLGIVGIAPKAKLMVLKALNQQTKSIGGAVAIARAVVYAADQEADIINMSFVARGKNPLLNDVLGYASQRGSILISASGRGVGPGPLEGPTQDLSPGQNADVIVVGGIDRDHQPLIYNKAGTNLSVMAPGDEILTLNHSVDNGPGYLINSGSSLAAAYVSGVAALLLSVDPTLNAQNIRNVLETTATDFGQPGFDTTYGYGVINPREAICMISTTLCNEIERLDFNLPPTILDLKKTRFLTNEDVSIPFSTYDEQQAESLITLKLNQLPEGMNFDPISKALSWEANSVLPGRYTFTLIADDGRESFEKDFVIVIAQPLRTVQSGFLSGSTPGGCQSSQSPFQIILLLLPALYFIQKKRYC